MGTIHKYEGYETPIERLRNKLGPFMTLAEILNHDEATVLPFIGEKCDALNDSYERLLTQCEVNKDEIKEYLSDAESFYVRKNNWIPINDVCDLPKSDRDTVWYFAASDDYVYKTQYTAEGLRQEYERFGLTHYQVVIYPDAP